MNRITVAEVGRLLLIRPYQAKKFFKSHDIMYHFENGKRVTKLDYFIWWVKEYGEEKLKGSAIARIERALL